VVEFKEDVMKKRFIGPEDELEARLPFKCGGCGKIIDNPTEEEASISRCDDCTAKEEQENP
jgi:hypothetical protein